MTGAELRARRLALDFTTATSLARALRLSPAAVSHYESGRREIPEWFVAALDGLAFRKQTDSHYWYRRYTKAAEAAKEAENG